MQTVVVLAIPFSLVFMVLSGQYSGEGFVVGYLLSLIVLTLGNAKALNLKVGRVHRQVFFALWYVLRLTWDIFWSSVDVTKIVLSKDIKNAVDPEIITISTQDSKNNGIVTAMSSHGITITPGQLVVDITESDGQTWLEVHNLHADNARPTIEQEQAQRLHWIQEILGYERH